MATEDDLRDAAERRLKAQRSFWALLGVFVVVWIICWGVWGISYATSEVHKTQGFWPLWVMFGTGIALLFSGWNAFGPRQGEITNEQIDAEVRKMKGQ
ncbi:MAG: 2TM domain-containing protein [Actinobacteria bacterium]|nr:2TM domain-containing protein [Actinomycetota bacterium]